MLGFVLVPRRLCPIAGACRLPFCFNGHLARWRGPRIQEYIPTVLHVEQISASLAELRTIADPCHSHPSLPKWISSSIIGCAELRVKCALHISRSGSPGSLSTCRPCAATMEIISVATAKARTLTCDVGSGQPLEEVRCWNHMWQIYSTFSPPATSPFSSCNVGLRPRRHMRRLVA